MRNSARNGFTLLEMTIVLVIIALLAAGILVGRSLMESSRLVRITSELAETQAQINLFYTKYKQLPGDLATATSFWPTCACNGDNDSMIDSVPTEEGETVWPMLSLSGIEAKSYQVGRAIALTGNIDQMNIYQKQSKADPLVYYRVHSAGPTTARNHIKVGGFVGKNNVTSTTADQVVLSPPDAASIDQKMDDGFATTGEIYTTSVANCTVGGNEYLKNVDNTHLGQGCLLFYNLPF